MEAKLRKQQEESQNDSKWLQQQENNIKKRLSVSSLNELPNENCVMGKPPIAEKPTTLRNDHIPVAKVEKKVDPEDRKNDPVYKAVTNVVKAVMQLSGGVEKALSDDYLELVKTVGIELRTLLGVVDMISSRFPPQTLK
jgi:hypothetical protein